MRSRALLLKQLIGDSMYVVDERSVAAAIMARAALRATVAEPELRNEASAGVVRSFRRDQRARSFRLERSSGVHFRR